MKNLILFFSMIVATSSVFSEERDKGLFVSYELLEMSENNFQYFAGDIGYRFDRRNQVRFIIMEVKLTEEHLSSEWAKIVDGNNVEGYMRGYEVTYDRFFTKNWYYMANISYISLEFEHTKVNDRYKNETVALGTGIGYRYDNFLGVNGLFINPSIPLRVFLNPVEETKLGDSTVNEAVLAPSIWMFVGYQFN